MKQKEEKMDEIKKLHVIVVDSEHFHAVVNSLPELWLDAYGHFHDRMSKTARTDFEIHADIIKKIEFCQRDLFKIYGNESISHYKLLMAIVHKLKNYASWLGYAQYSIDERKLKNIVLALPALKKAIDALIAMNLDEMIKIRNEIPSDED